MKQKFLFSFNKREYKFPYTLKFDLNTSEIVLWIRKKGWESIYGATDHYSVDKTVAVLVKKKSEFCSVNDRE